MLRKMVVAVLLCVASLGAGATEFTDVYVDTNETGWGIFVVQSDTFEFLCVLRLWSGRQADVVFVLAQPRCERQLQRATLRVHRSLLRRAVGSVGAAHCCRRRLYVCADRHL